MDGKFLGLPFYPEGTVDIGTASPNALFTIIDEDQLYRTGIVKGGKEMAKFWDEQVILDPSKMPRGKPARFPHPAPNYPGLDIPPKVDKVVADFYEAVGSVDGVDVLRLGDYYVPESAEVDDFLIRIRQLSPKNENGVPIMQSIIDRIPVIRINYNKIFSRAKITPDKKIGVMIVSGMHAREWFTIELVLRMLKHHQSVIQMLQSMISKGSSPETILKNSNIPDYRSYVFYIIPCINLYSFYMTTTQTDYFQGLGSSLRQQIPEGEFYYSDRHSRKFDGADPNRSYDVMWGHPDGCNPNDKYAEDYCGPYPLSLQFTRAHARMLDMLQQRNEIQLVLDIHSYGNTLMQAPTFHYDKLDIHGNKVWQSDYKKMKAASELPIAKRAYALTKSKFLEYFSYGGKTFLDETYENKITYEAIGGMADHAFMHNGMLAYVIELGEDQAGFSVNAGKNPEMLKPNGLPLMFQKFFEDKKVQQTLQEWKEQQETPAWRNMFTAQYRDIVSLTREGKKLWKAHSH